jgi:serine/threonine protein kinase
MAWSLMTTRLSESEKKHLLSDSTVEIWRQDRPIGQGGFGFVWQETCVSGPRQGQLRAVKHIRKSAEVMQYLHRELEILALFATSRNKDAELFAAFTGWFADQQHVYIALEFVPHGDLQQHINTKPLPEQDVAVVMVQVAKALRCLHDGGYVHRDLKPAVSWLPRTGPRK